MRRIAYMTEDLALLVEQRRDVAARVGDGVDDLFEPVAWVAVGVAPIRLRAQRSACFLLRSPKNGRGCSRDLPVRLGVKPAIRLDHRDVLR